MARTKTKGKAQVDKLAQRLETLSVEYVPVADIKPNPWNPNRQSEHEAELLRRSMDEDGFTQPVLVVRLTKDDLADDKIKAHGGYSVGDLMIVDGEHRWRTGAALGYAEIPAVVYPGGAIQARISTMRHNKARGTHDMELEADLLRDLEALGALSWAQDSLMMDDVEVQRLMDDLPAPEALASEQFGQGWEPGGIEDSGGDVQRFGATARVSLTPEAIQAQREAEKRVQAARTEEEKAAARRDVQIYRLNVTFSAEEGALVKRVLGDQPASRLLELCKAADTA